MEAKTPEGWPELRDLLLDPNVDDLATVKVEVEGRAFEVEVLRMKGYVRTQATVQMRGKVYCGKCRQQKHKTVGFSCSANGTCAISVCHDCLRALITDDE